MKYGAQTHGPAAERRPGGAGMASRNAASPKRAVGNYGSAGEPAAVHAGGHGSPLEGDFKEF